MTLHDHPLPGDSSATNGDRSAGSPRKPHRRLVIVVRADPVVCGHSGEARNLAEAAIDRGFDEVRIVTWPIERLQASGLPADFGLPSSPVNRTA